MGSQEKSWLFCCDLGRFGCKNENICRNLQIYLYISKKIITFAPDLGAEAQARAYMCTQIRESNLRRSLERERVRGIQNILK